MINRRSVVYPGSGHHEGVIPYVLLFLYIFVYKSVLLLQRVCSCYKMSCSSPKNDLLSSARRSFPFIPCQGALQGPPNLARKAPAQDLSPVPLTPPVDRQSAGVPEESQGRCPDGALHDTPNCSPGPTSLGQSAGGNGVVVILVDPSAQAEWASQ